MKKRSLFILLIPFLLTACSDNESEINVLEDHDYQVDEIRFEYEDGFLVGNSYIYVDTEQETFVLGLSESKFIKSKEPSTTINVKLLEDEVIGKFTEVIIYVNQKDVPKISKMYAAEFKETLEFTDEVEEVKK